MLIALLSFSGSLATKYVSLNNEPYMMRPTLIDLKLAELNYYPFTITLDKYNGSCNVVDDLFTKISVPSERKDLNVKVFKMITSEVKTLVKRVSCDCKCKINFCNCNSTCNSDQKWNNDKCQYECKKYCMCIKDYSCNPSTCICENSRYSKSVVDDSVILCNEIVKVADSVSNSVTNAVSKNVTIAVSINSYDKTVDIK